MPFWWSSVCFPNWKSIFMQKISVTGTAAKIENKILSFLPCCYAALHINKHVVLFSLLYDGQQDCWLVLRTKYTLWMWAWSFSYWGTKICNPLVTEKPGWNPPMLLQPSAVTKEEPITGYKNHSVYSSKYSQSFYFWYPKSCSTISPAVGVTVKFQVMR